MPNGGVDGSTSGRQQQHPHDLHHLETIAYQYHVRKRRHLVAILADVVDGCRKLKKERRLKREEKERKEEDEREEKLKILIGEASGKVTKAAANKTAGASVASTR